MRATVKDKLALHWFSFYFCVSLFASMPAKIKAVRGDQKLKQQQSKTNVAKLTKFSSLISGIYKTTLYHQYQMTRLRSSKGSGYCKY